MIHQKEQSGGLSVGKANSREDSVGDLENRVRERRMQFRRHGLQFKTPMAHVWSVYPIAPFNIHFEVSDSQLMDSATMRRSF